MLSRTRVFALAVLISLAETTYDVDVPHTNNTRLVDGCKE